MVTESDLQQRQEKEQKVAERRERRNMRKKVRVTEPGEAVQAPTEPVVIAQDEWTSRDELPTTDVVQVETSLVEALIQEKLQLVDEPAMSNDNAEDAEQSKSHGQRRKRINEDARRQRQPRAEHSDDTQTSESEQEESQAESASESAEQGRSRRSRRRPTETATSSTDVVEQEAVNVVPTAVVVEASEPVVRESETPVAVVAEAAVAIAAQVETQVAQPVVAIEPQPEPMEAVAPVVQAQVEAAKPRKAHRNGVLSQVHFAQAEMALPAPAPELPVQAIDYPPFERQPAQVSGRKASIKDLRSIASAPAWRPTAD